MGQCFPRRDAENTEENAEKANKQRLLGKLKTGGKLSATQSCLDLERNLPGIGKSQGFLCVFLCTSASLRGSKAPIAQKRKGSK